MAKTQSPGDVAAWMLERLTGERCLYQEVAVYEIEKRFGKGFTYTNELGNPAIDRAVLREFRKLTEGEVVWDRGERMWRYRESHEPTDRRQVD